MNSPIFHLYSYTNYYGEKRYAVAYERAMPKNYDEIIFTGDFDYCSELLKSYKQQPSLFKSKI